ncbi:MAG: glycosyltransferase [Balneolaceae bacterium]
MKILHLYPYLPAPPTFGGALRIYHILKHLTEYHDVTVGGYSEHGDEKYFRREFPSLENKMHFIKRSHEKYRRLMQLYACFTSHSYWYQWSQSKAFERKLNELLERQNFDFVISEFASMGHFELETDAIRILDAHNVEYDNFRRMSKLNYSPIRRKYYEREFKRSFHEEVAAFKRHDAIFTTSARDGKLIQKDAPKPAHFVIPNGVDTDFFQKGNTRSEPFTLVFTGSMRYVPNYDGMIYFIEEIFPEIKKEVPEAKIYIVGSGPPNILKKHQSDSVIITGFVDDVRPYIDRASVFVVPLRMGSGTRLKVVEALSMQKPVVSTSIGCEGIDVENEKHLVIRDHPQAFAEAVLELFKAQKLRNRLISNGYELVKNKYDWSVIGESIDEALHQLQKKEEVGERVVK